MHSSPKTSYQTLSSFEEGSEPCVFEPFPTAKEFRSWKLTFKLAVANYSGRPDEAFQWISKCEDADNIGDVEEDEGFESLSAKTREGLEMILNEDVRTTLELLKHKEALQNKRILIEHLLFSIALDYPRGVSEIL